MMQVAFVNENMLGHASYLLPFVRALRERPELGVTPHVINATPLPPRLALWANSTVRGLRRWGLDFHIARWRRLTSRHVRTQLEGLRARQHIDAVVVNTQSVALDLLLIAKELPVYVCLDATFAQLARSSWFAPNTFSRCVLPLTAAPIRARERELFDCARRLLAWSEPVRRSLIEDYDTAPARISWLPPSLDLSLIQPRSRMGSLGPKPQILFMGGDFYRKGGPLLRDCFRRYFASRCELHVVTQSDLLADAAMFVHHGLTPYTEAWLQRWQQADVFVFPSRLETFGIVLLEALAFQVPIIATEVGVAREILHGGQAGILLKSFDVECLAMGIEETLTRPDLARDRVGFGRRAVESHYDLREHVTRLASWLLN